VTRVQVSCDTGDQGCNGGYLDHAWKYLRDTGIVTDACFPYGAGRGTAPACRTACVNASIPFKKYKSADFFQIKGEDDIMKEIFTNGPVEAGFRVYSSFMSYSAGVYHKKFLDIIEGGRKTAHCRTLQHCSMLRYSAQPNTLRLEAKHCNTLQHTTFIAKQSFLSWR